MFMALSYSLLMIILARLLHYKISDHDAARSRALVIGTGKKAMMVEELRRKSDLYGIKLMGFLYVAGENSRVSEESIMRIDESLLSYVNNNTIEELVVAVDDRRRSFPVDEILECKMDGILVSEVSDFIERQVQKIRLNTLHPSSMIFSEGYTRAVVNSFGKRAFDIIASSFLLLVTLPVMALTALSIWLESGFKGSILYKQERVGMDGKLFYVIKFRSMREDAENDGVAQWAQKGDNRLTKNGNVIRILRIDELPQLYNVLKGEMSFVGPRPERPEFVQKLAQVIPFYNLRHKVKPGITGWAQISYPYGASEHDSIEKLQYDLYYIKRYSLKFDAFILFQTVQAVLWQRGGR
jgi:sugar transferase (PEP-CTERM system associated)